MASKQLSPVEQGELALSRRAPANDMPIELVRRQKTGAAAFALACQSSGLEDKEIYLAIGVDAGYFSRIKAGTATLQADLVPFFCDVVGNRIYPEWQAFQVGCTLVQIQSEAERRADAAERRAAEAELKVRVLMETFHARAAA
ncbi:transcriptional regulator [Hydrogenophaga sp. 2FB]|uniref:transcriptional regulator n=1 Tax=Hydrogenophaga sp. 2FB TaxID=2502187 RepID=UPI00207BB314|nr:transcriptional regulator [Hydrogenophaga sp. 2FB]